ncbi:MAG: InlB B-repeat-containing protein, partial [Planctomycetota bacterium]
MKTYTIKSILTLAASLTFFISNLSPITAAEKIVSSDNREYRPDLVLMLGSTALSQDPDGNYIVSGKTDSGTIFPGGDTDAFTFYGEKDQGVVIEMADNSSSGDLYPRLQLYDPDGVRLIQDWSFDIARIENYQLQTKGMYTIVASSYFANTGEYRLSLALTPGATTSPQDPNGGNIASNETIIGDISPAGDTDICSFYGQIGQGIVIELADNSYSGDLYPRLQLYDPYGVRLVEDWSFDVARIEDYQLQATGMYTIVASSYFASVGQYGLSLELMASDDPHGLYPYDPQPSDGNSVSLCDWNTLNWWPVDEATGYDVYFTLEPFQPMEKIAENIAVSYLSMPQIEQEQVCYWMVIAHTPSGDIKGPLWWFTAELCRSYSLTISAIGQGSIVDPNEGFHKYSYGELVSVTAMADINYSFVRWEGTAVDANKIVVEYQDHM